MDARRAPGRLDVACVAAVALCTQAVCSGGGSSGSSSAAPGPAAVELSPAFGGIAFSRAVKLVQHPTDDDRWYVVEQGGTVETFLASDPAATVATVVDVTSAAGGNVDLGSGNEQGLLGLAFDPDFDATGGELYLAYTDDGGGRCVLARYESTDGGQSFTPAMDPVVLAIPHPRDNHNASDLHFGVNDDFLYYGMGDGGGADDPDENGQDPTTLLGTVLRLDVRSAPPVGRSYAIPADNPFQGNPVCDTGASPMDLACPEIWAYGLRNPWRMGFDSQTGDLWLGDVGQGAQEEVDRVVPGGNYGWDCVEGELDHEYVPPCDRAGFQPPRAVYANPGGAMTPRAVTGGLVYRGSAIPGLVGHYLYADFYTGEVWALDAGAMDPPVRILDSGQNVAAFAEDGSGEVYLVTFGSPSIYALVPAPPS